MDGFGIKLAINALKTLAFIYDIITYPIYFIIQNPWRRLRLSKRIKVGNYYSTTTTISYMHEFYITNYYSVAKEWTIQGENIFYYQFCQAIVILGKNDGKIRLS